MSQTVITSAFEQLKAQEAANGGVVILDEFVFANIPNLDITSPIDRGEGLPDAALIVHRQAVGKTGMVNNNAVVYSVVMGADVGDFDFNWVGLVNSANNVVAMIVHAPTQKKIKTATGQQGNVLTRSFLMEYNGASEQTQIITPADTWQIDFTARLNGVDERIRRENMDIYGEASFLGDGFLVTKTGSQYVVNKGVGYVAGVRGELLFDQNITVSQKPVKVWADVTWKGTLTSVWASGVTLTVAETLENYTDNDEQHYVFAIAQINADGTVADFRQVTGTDAAGIAGELRNKQPLDATLTALAELETGKNKLPYFTGNDSASQTDITEVGRGLIGCESLDDALHFLNIKSASLTITPQDFYAVADGVHDDTDAITAAINEAAERNLTLFFPGGIYKSADIEINTPVNIELSGGAFLDFAIVFRGEHFSAKNTIRTSLGWDSVPAGTKKITGNFSRFTPGGMVAVKLSDSAGGDVVYGNEAGMDFSRITSADVASVLLASGTRFAYQYPEVIELAAAVQYSGTLEADAHLIQGDYSGFFSAGDIIRIENKTGTYAVEAKPYYFELAKVLSVSTESIVLKARLNYGYTDPFIVKTSFIKSPKVYGKGRIKRLEIRQCDEPVVNGISVDRLIVGYNYDSSVGDINSRGVQEPSSVNHSYCFGRSKAFNIRAGGSLGITDNAANKFMSCPGMQISNISADNSTATGTQGDYSLYIDALFTPYYCWNKNMIVDGVTAERPRSPVTRGVWFYGLRDSVVRNISGAQTFIQGCVNSLFDGIVTPNDPLEVKDVVSCDIKGIFKSIEWLGCHKSRLEAIATGVGAGSSNKIVLRAGAGGRNPTDGTAYVQGTRNRFEVISHTDDEAAITIQMSYQAYPIIGGRCSDLPTVAASVSLGSGIISPRMEGNFLEGAISQSSAWQGVRIKGGFTLDGNYSDANITWNGRHVWLSGDGYLRTSLTVPTSDHPSGASTIGPQ